MVGPLTGARRLWSGGSQLAAVPVASAHRREERGADLPAAAQYKRGPGVPVGPHRGAGLDGLGGSWSATG